MKRSVPKDIAVFGMLASIMFASKKLMEGLPNIHLIGVFIIALTVVYRKRALYPIYIYILLDGIFCGFNPAWVPYLYIWALLWGAVMLLPQNLPGRAAPFIYGVLCGLHGILFGVLYAPAQALLFGLDLRGMLLWIASGFTFDCIHGAGNLILGTVLTVPLIRVMKKFG